MSSRNRILYALIATLAAVFFTTTTALAGSGVGGVFNLGQTNTVNAKTTLTGATSDVQLLVQNTGSGSALNLVGGAGAAPFKVNSATKIVSLNADLLDGLDSAALQKRVTGTCASGQAIRVITATGGVTCQVVGGTGGLWSLNGNGGTTPGTNFLGTNDNKALELKVNKQRALRLEPSATSPNVIGGFSGNTASPEVFGATIGGGGETGNTNSVQSNFGTVGGGLLNTASEDATVGGGFQNSATGIMSTVPGGSNNTASGIGSFVAGRYSTASGNDSLAAGFLAVADDPFSFVWSDGQWSGGNVYSPAAYSFSAHAIGGYNFWTNASGPTTGCWIVAGGGSLNCSSSRAVKRDFAPVDRQRILRRVAHLPITSWSYKNEKGGARHIGPMAQDFARAFSLGQGNTSIAMVDSDGVALAAIQGLYRQNQALQRQNHALRSQLESQDARLTRLERAFAAQSSR